MQSSLEVLDGLKRKITVEIPVETIEKELENKLRSLKNRVKMDGFRPGKVPMTVVKRQYGSSARMEVLNHLIEQSYQEALQEKEIQPAATLEVRPLSGFADNESLKYEAIFEVMPEVKVALEGLRVTLPTANIQDTDVDEMLQTLRHQQGHWHESSEAATSDKRVTIDFQGTLDGEAFEGGSGEKFVFQLGQGQMLPDFEAGIEGMHVGEEKTFDVRFPNDYSAEKLAGKTTQFKVKLHKVEDEHLPEINDEFIKLFGVNEGGLEAFKTAVRENMERELDKALRQLKRQAVFNALLEKNAEQELSEGVVQREIERIAEETKVEKNITDKAAREEFKKNVLDGIARRRVRLGLLLGKLFEDMNIELDRTLVEERLQSIASTYEDPQEVINWYRKDQQARVGLESAILEEQLINRLAEEAEVAEEEKTFREIMALYERSRMAS